jgi:hypothetical protein
MLAGRPPRDVERLLQRHGVQLPHYLDVRRNASAKGWRERWTLLRVLPPGSAA